MVLPVRKWISSARSFLSYLVNAPNPEMTSVVAELVSQCLAKGRQVFLGSLKRHLLVERIALAALGAGLGTTSL